MALGFTVAVLLMGGGFWWWQGHHGKPVKKLSVAQTVGDHVIPLNQTPPASSNNGLSVTSGATSLGQLDAKQQGSGGGDSSSSGSGGGIDPTKFGEYDKYKDGQNALFGEMQVGTGAELTAGKKAAVLYMGWLTNGTLFDQSPTGSDGKMQAYPFTMGAHQVIPGREQGLAGMKVGGVRLVIVPPAVGYGAQGQGPIPGNAVLVFYVRLVAVQ